MLSQIKLQVPLLVVPFRQFLQVSALQPYLPRNPKAVSDNFFFFNFDFPSLGSNLTPGGLAHVAFLYLVLCIFVVIMCYKILLQYLLPVF